MMSRSSPGRFSRTNFSRSRNFVAVRTLVAICWRSVAIIDYSCDGKRSACSRASFAMKDPLKCVHALTHTQHMPWQREMSACLDQRNDTIKVWSGMGTSNDDSNRMKKIFSFGAGFLFYVIDNCFEVLRRESIASCPDKGSKFYNDFPPDLRCEERLIVFGFDRRLSVIAQQELGFIR